MKEPVVPEDRTQRRAPSARALGAPRVQCPRHPAGTVPPARIVRLVRSGRAAAAPLVLAAAVLTAATPGQHPDLRETTVRVGDAEIRALCTSRRPQVILLHGEDSSADAWRPVLDRLEGRVGACAYDRRGSGESGDAPEPRGWYELLDELRRIHDELGARTPYVLAGYSLGGLYARLYAADRPGDVAGLVLVEPAHEDMPRRARPGMPADAWNAWMERRRRPNADGVVEERLGERARGSRLPAIPVTVLTATRRRTGEGWDPRFLNEAARQVHESILQGVSGARHVPAAGSGPAIHRDDPALVASEIVRIVGAAEARRR
jgi:pimeloyl-ACP methyl ester carboxylesterase